LGTDHTISNRRSSSKKKLDAARCTLCPVIQLQCVCIILSPVTIDRFFFFGTIISPLIYEPAAFGLAMKKYLLEFIFGSNS
jgi:hypothetical protein